MLLVLKSQNGEVAYGVVLCHNDDMKRVFLPLSWLMRALSWPVTICLAVEFCLLAIVVWDAFPLGLRRGAHALSLLFFFLVMPSLILWRGLWGIFRLFQRRFREGLVALFVGVPLAVGMWWGGLCLLVMFIIFSELPPDERGRSFAFPTEQPIALPISNGPGVSAPLIWMMKQPDAAARLDRLVASNPEHWAWRDEPSPVLMWKQGDEVWTLEKRTSLCYDGLSGPGTLDEAAVLEALRPIFGEFRVDSPEEPVFLRVGIQPGIYELTSTLGRPLTLTAKTSHGGRILSGLERQSFPKEGGEFTIYEGDWEDYYGVEIELHDAETGASLFRRVYLLDGWMR